ncbi:MAG: enoyl-CoA hydratase/isomerase family protein [Actinobacteria bacterium]|nr:enoyl-CoA hydratase/isomerase family protein [Actinomycetota bacterium]MCG2818546.1 3-hydroxyacyl-CoA dehydrogenase NAD-binding domain-containing protein [Actinomycetes bacterium]MBU4179817.1 enoyl-CoA hydratase/isomerase family protein [Actinomycetota bacterium]MBU4218265.1 enoyl-CoA hydratase/isomerase family protein [Actinomycetota bacterium]MBU4358690.1 enoyl-CoA hydratase/isomerase family protein [Actinomycetota bacterium]
MAEDLVTQFKVTYHNNPRAGKLAIMTMDNGADYRKPNTLGAGALESLNQAMDNLDGDIKGLVLTGKTFIFCVGANLMEVPEITSSEEAIETGRRGHAAFKRIMDIEVPTLAAINGAVMGGGLEISLYCDYRTVSTGVTVLALPECFLGLIPGWGGTQLVPRLVGPEKALLLIVQNPLSNNRMMNGKKGFELGLGERLFEPVEFMDESIEFLADIITGEVTIKREKPDYSNIDQLIDTARGLVTARVHSGAIAPYRALDLIKGSAEWSLDEGFAQEDQALGELIMSNQMRASVYSFDLAQRRAKKQVGIPAEGPLPINKVGVIGAGLMASQLGFLFLRRLEVPLVMKDISQDVLDKCKAYIDGELDRLVGKGRLPEPKANYLKSIVTYTLEDKDFEGCDFIIEAVFENLGLKKKIFAAAEEYLSDTAVMATNTSSLSITEMAGDLKHPERVIGFHFFNPVAVLPLLEIIRGEKTNDVTCATAGAVAKKIKKTIVVMKDAPGFLVNRMLIRNMVEVMDIVDGPNTFEEVDEAVSDLGLPMSPFDLLALVGPAVALHATETLADAFPERYHVSENFARLVEEKKPGVYIMTEKGKEVDPEVLAFWEKDDSKPKLSADEIRARMLKSLADEAHRILEDGVVAEPQDIDTGMIMGAGYPFFMGGVTRYLDQSGVSEEVFGARFLTDDELLAYFRR